MIHVTQYSKRLLFLILLTLIPSVSFSAQLAYDDFSNGSLDGWGGDAYTWNDDGYMYINRDQTATKTYDFGTSYANQTLYVTFRFYVPSAWETSGSYVDYLNIFMNGTLIKQYQGSGNYYIESFEITTDGNGLVTLDVVPDSTASDEWVGIDYFSITTTKPITINSTRPFSLRYLANLKGNIRVIGNTVLRSIDGYTQANNQETLLYTDTDSDASTFNSSSATIEGTYADVDISNAKILWAGLYWQGYLHSDDGDTGIDSQYTIANNANANTQIQNILTTQQILLKKGTGSYVPITPTEINVDRQYNDTNYIADKYGAFADVTSLLQGASPADTYTIANVPTREGRASSGNNWDALGNYGAWTLVIVYDNSATPEEKIRNVSVFDGYLVLNDTTTQIDIPVSGFKTPTDDTVPVDSTLSVFAAEGDAFIPGDYLHLINESGYEYALTSSGGATNFFNSSIEGVDTRSPQLSNNMGIDIHTQQVGTKGGSDKPIKPNQTSATLRIGTNGDHFVPQMISLATELYIPKLCYDYTVRQNNFDITEDNRTIQAIGGGELSINLALQSQEGDFDFEHSKVNIELVPTTDTTFKDAYYSPNNVNTYVPAIYTANHTTTRPEIAVGEYVTPDGGTFKALQRYYAQFNWDLDSNSYEGRFDVELNTTIDFGSGPVPLSMSTKYGTLPRCTQVAGYHPLYGTYNVERHNSSGAPEEKYPLYTQVVGKDFDFDVVAYSKDPAPAYQTELPLDGYTVAVELINARSFQDENATFLCDNPDPAIIQKLDTLGTQEIFAEFNNTSRVDLSSLNISVERALRSAAFRIWYIVDDNGTIVPHTCTNRSDNSCFQEIYDTYISQTDTTLQASGTHGFCSVETIGGNGCSDYINQKTGARGCYACLRDHFSRPVCSRDNFAIRPAAYRVSISDGDEQDTPAVTKELGVNKRNDTEPTATLAAGYKYKLDANATSYLGDNVVAKGYTRYFDNTDLSNLASMLKFKDVTACFDKNNTSWGVYFDNGSIRGIYNGASIKYDPGHIVMHSNVGKYGYILHDSNWTIVDQQRYPYKTFPGDDCLLNDNSIATTSIGMSGCDIDTKLTDNTGLNNPVYNDLYLRFHPYAFGLDDINFSVQPDSRYLFMTDLSDAYYQTVSSFSNRMSNIYEGNITSLAKTGTRTTNFTTGCAATDLSLAIALTSKPNQIILSGQGTTFQKTLQYGSSLDLVTTYNDQQTGADTNLTLSKDAFEDAVAQGSAKIRIYTTFKKPHKDEILDGSEGINPIIANYKEINASSVDANSSAHLGIHIPEGTKAFDRNVTFLYAKVSPNEMLYKTEEDEIATPLNIIIYCDLTPDECRNYDLNSSFSAAHESGNWYTASGFFDQRQDLGTSDLNVSYYTGKLPGNAMIALRGDTPMAPATTLNDVFYKTTGIQDDLVVSLPTDNPRPVTVQIDYRSDPWLEYDPVTQYYRVRFIPKPTAWTGFGKTGHVVDDDISTTKSKRLEW